MNLIKSVRIIGAPYHYGKDDSLNSDAPNAIRNSGLRMAFDVARIPYKDNGDLEVGHPLNHHTALYKKLKFLPEVLEITRLLREVVMATVKDNEIPIVIGGDHSIAIGSLLGMSAVRQEVTVIWIDSHGDFHTSKTTPSGRLHGMALALSLGLDKEFCKLFSGDVRYLDKDKVVMFGAQKFDPGEKEAVVKNISLIDMQYIIRYGIGQAVEELLKRIKTKNIYISLDLDSVDRQYAPGTDMAIDGALTYRELLYVIENLAKKRNVVGMDVVEYEPGNDVDKITAKLAIESITTALGRRVGVYELYMNDLAQVEQ